LEGFVKDLNFDENIFVKINNFIMTIVLKELLSDLNYIGVMVNETRLIRFKKINNEFTLVKTNK
jgi:hypothetical protein